MTPRHILKLALATILSAGCSDDTPENLATVFGLDVEEVVIEVDYQEGAEPYTDAPLVEGNPNPWELFINNAEALFSEDPKILTVPIEVEDMELLTDVGSDQDFTADRILEIADLHREESGSDERWTYYVLFLDGYLYDSQGRQEGVAGVSIGDTGVIAMFKPVAESTNTERFVEQTVLIHEFGHAAGLVDIGVPMVEPHRDHAHGAHCNNSSCVMYWLNESGRDAALFVANYILTGETVVFGEQCLADAHAAAH